MTTNTDAPIEPTREQVNAALLAFYPSDWTRSIQFDAMKRALIAAALCAPTPSVQAEAVRVDEHVVTLTGYQLLVALEFIAPDRDADPDQLESEVTIQLGDGHSGRGYYCWVTDYPDEGAILLSPDVAPASSAGDQA